MTGIHQKKSAFHRFFVACCDKSGEPTDTSEQEQVVALPGPGPYNQPLIEATRYRFARRLPVAGRTEVDAHRITLAP